MFTQTKKTENVLLRWNDLICVFWVSVRGASNYNKRHLTFLLRRFRNRQITISLLLFWKLQFWIFQDLWGPARSWPFVGRGVPKSYLGKNQLFLLLLISRGYFSIVNCTELYWIRQLIQYLKQYIEIIEILNYDIAIILQYYWNYWIILKYWIISILLNILNYIELGG